MQGAPKTATHIRDVEGWRGHASLYRLDPPLEGWDYMSGAPPKTYDHVIVSAVTTLQVNGEGPETYIFPARPDGEVIDMVELPGSRKGTLSHEAVLAGAGYSLTKAEAAR